MRRRVRALVVLAAALLVGQTRPAAPAELAVPAAQTAVPITWAALKAYLEAPKEQVVVVDFWATWCVPCVKALPEYAKLMAQRQDVRVVLVSFDDDDAAARQAIAARLRAAGMKVGTFLVADRAEQVKIVNAINPQWKDVVLPASFVYDRSGRQVFAEVSGGTKTAAEWEQVLADLRSE